MKKEIESFTQKNGHLTPETLLVVKHAIFVLGSNTHIFTWKVYFFNWMIWTINWRICLTKKMWVSLMKKWGLYPKNIFWGFSNRWNGCQAKNEKIKTLFIMKFTITHYPRVTFQSKEFLLYEALYCRALNEGSLRFPGLSVADLSPCWEMFMFCSCFRP